MLCASEACRVKRLFTCHHQNVLGSQGCFDGMTMINQTPVIRKSTSMFQFARRFTVPFVSLALTLACITSAQAEAVPFDNTWKEQGFLRLFSNEYKLKGSRLDVVSDGTVSVIWRPVFPSAGDATKANWAWAVSQGVPATDLTRKGGDDRNLAIYFVFVDAETAKTLNRNSARKLLRNSSTRSLVYVWGGSHSKGTILNSPYSSSLKTKILRTGQSGKFSEQVNLVADYKKAFGSAPEVLVGLAVTADSDDTDSKIEAQISGLRIE